MKDPAIENHFARKDPVVLATYRRVLGAARALGQVTEEAKKTSIHLVRRTAFAGIATRRASLIHPQIIDGHPQSAHREARTDIAEPVARRDPSG
jgi:hypothetical protein